MKKQIDKKRIIKKDFHQEGSRMIETLKRSTWESIKKGVRNALEQRIENRSWRLRRLARSLNLDLESLVQDLVRSRRSKQRRCRQQRVYRVGPEDSEKGAGSNKEPLRPSN